MGVGVHPHVNSTIGFVSREGILDAPSKLGWRGYVQTSQEAVAVVQARDSGGWMTESGEGAGGMLKRLTLNRTWIARESFRRTSMCPAFATGWLVPFTGGKSTGRGSDLR